MGVVTIGKLSAKPGATLLLIGGMHQKAPLRHRGEDTPKRCQYLTLGFGSCDYAVLLPHPLACAACVRRVGAEHMWVLILYMPSFCNLFFNVGASTQRHSQLDREEDCTVRGA
eukprot:TRINITY_DN1208_c0_g1_i2.p2 TRINITY_DN1208_c0_g1~~TRINITY_DN1208_c0_g1_i2.p2  ORF type:complete len:113 (-),score=1.12 TRINITY_DN1208_c0_g1_i2:290-628(-)